MGRLIEDHRPILRRQPLQALAALLFLRREKALEGEAGRGQAGDAQGRDGSAGAGDGADRDALLGAEPDQSLAGVGDRGAACVRDQGAALPRLQTGQDLRPALGLVVLVVADQGLFDFQMIEQPDRDAGVLGGNEIHGAQRLGGTGGDVAQVADRRRD